ncbi:unnamed protein product, partial [Pleuronectes platessa]
MRTVSLLSRRFICSSAASQSFLRSPRTHLAAAAAHRAGRGEPERAVRGTTGDFRSLPRNSCASATETHTEQFSAYLKECDSADVASPQGEGWISRPVFQQLSPARTKCKDRHRRIGLLRRISFTCRPEEPEIKALIDAAGDMSCGKRFGLVSAFLGIVLARLSQCNQ